MNQKVKAPARNMACVMVSMLHTHANGSGRGEDVCAHKYVCVQSVLITGKSCIGPGGREGRGCVCTHECVCVQSSVLITGKSCISLFTKMNPRSQGSLLRHLKHGVAQL